MRYLGAAAALLLFTPCIATAQLKQLREDREIHLRNVRQLTFGGQNAEAYWSFDGKKIIFQFKSDRPGDADQVYTMNADGSGKKLVSTGKGRCTCAYFLPGGKEIIFSSTHGYSPNTP